MRSVSVGDPRAGRRPAAPRVLEAVRAPGRARADRGGLGLARRLASSSPRRWPDRADRDPAGRVRARPHPQPRRRAHHRGADLLPDPGRRARSPGWLAAYREAFELDPRVGAAFGPHLPDPDTSPMIARELMEFFAGFSPDGGPALQRAGGLTFLSNVNACYLRECWAGDPLRRPPLQRGPGLRPGDARGRLGEGLPPGRCRAPRPRLRAARVHEALLRRVPRAAPGQRARGAAAAARCAPRGRAPTLAGCDEQGKPPRERAAGSARSAVHQGGRRAAAALGSRADAPAGPRCSGALSLEGRGAARRGEPGRAAAAC